jgi:hypothetical protein
MVSLYYPMVCIGDFVWKLHTVYSIDQLTEIFVGDYVRIILNVMFYWQWLYDEVAYFVFSFRLQADNLIVPTSHIGARVYRYAIFQHFWD